MNTELDKSILDVENLLKNKETPLVETTITDLESVISLAKATKIQISDKPKKLEELKAETEKLNQVDYQTIIEEITRKKIAYENSVKQLKQLTNPAESFIIKRIEGIEGITGVSAVTEDNDPNGKLNKQGGYTAQIYFTHSKVDATNVFGTSIIEKGTDGGGSIEVYKTTEEAKVRNEYLKAFDGNAMLKVGSHKVVGTVIVRTSDFLTASQQKELESKIIENLSKL